MKNTGDVKNIHIFSNFFIAQYERALLRPLEKLKFERKNDIDQVPRWSNKNFVFFNIVS